MTTKTNDNNSTSPQQRQYVWIVRYGRTEYPLVENVGPFDSDIDPKEGIEHAQAIARRITSTAVPTKVYASPFLRTAHTAHIIANSAAGSVCLEEGLAEWQVPSLLVEPDGKRTFPKDAHHHANTTFDNIDTTYQSLNPMDPSYFDETEEQLAQRCASTLEKILDHAKGQTIAIVSHAPCDIAMALAFSDMTLEQAKGKFPAWPLGGVTLFSKSPRETEWKMEFYGDSSHMPGSYKEGLQRWTLPSLT